MINKCKICGKEFNARQSNYNLCSDECRKINKKEYKKRQWWEIKADPYQHERHKQQRKKYNKAKREANPKPFKRCVQCGCDTGSYYMKYCLECLFDNYFKSPNTTNFCRLSNRGYNKAEILEEAEIRGVTVPEAKRGQKRR